MDIKKFAQRLEAARKTKKLSQEELGKLLGISRFPIIDWEAGRKTPDLSTASQIAECLEVSLDFLMGTSDTNQRPAPLGKNLRFFQEFPDGSLVPIQQIGRCHRNKAQLDALEEILANNPDLEVWFRTQKLSEEAKEEIARLLLSLKEKWSVESPSETEVNSHNDNETDGEEGNDEEGNLFLSKK